MPSSSTTAAAAPAALEAEEDNHIPDPVPYAQHHCRQQQRSQLTRHASQQPALKRVDQQQPWLAQPAGSGDHGTDDHGMGDALDFVDFTDIDGANEAEMAADFSDFLDGFVLDEHMQHGEHVS